MHKISAVIIGGQAAQRHEHNATQSIAYELKAQKDFTLKAVCSDYTQVGQVLYAQNPDVVFLHIELPGYDEMNLLKCMSISSSSLPLVVCIADTQDHAAKAFDCQALDYLLKPFSSQRLACCLQKIRMAIKQIQLQHQQDELDSLLTRKTGKSLAGFMHTLSQPGQISKDQLEETIAVKSGTEWLRICLNDIHWIEAAGDYVCIHTEGENHIIRSTLQGMHAALCPNRFVRFNRSSVVNSAKVIRFTPNSNGEYTAELINGESVKVSRRYKLGIAELCQ